jgi:hypothetical protein
MAKKAKRRKHQELPTDVLWTAKEVAAFLRLREKAVYGLRIPRIELSDRRVRWTPEDVRAYALARRAG